MSTREEDVVQHLLRADTLDHLLFFTNRGKVYCLRTYQLPEYQRAGRGLLIESVLPLEPEERVTAAVAVPTFEDVEGYFTMCTVRGRIKRVALSEFASVRPSGLVAISLDADDYLGWARHTSGNDDIILVSHQGRAIRFNENDVRVMGRSAAGVNAIRLLRGDVLAGMDVIPPDYAAADLLLVTERGYGKRTKLEEFRQQGRFGQGIRGIATDLSKTGGIVGAGVVTDEDSDLTVITSNGVALRTPVDSISTYGRTAQGVRVINIDPDDTVVSIALLVGESAVDENGEARKAQVEFEAGELAALDIEPDNERSDDDLEDN
jgi:DNA gyrase subunit A